MSLLFLDNSVRGAYSEHRVLRSAAGYYIGTMWEEFDASDNIIWQEPGTRDSEYFRDEAEAKIWLSLFTN